VSGGQTFSANDAGELREVYDGLATRVSTRDTERELTAYLVALALLIVLAGATTSMRWFARPA
jgi:Ca-activated chloride channel homolog